MLSTMNFTSPLMIKDNRSDFYQGIHTFLLLSLFLSLPPSFSLAPFNTCQYFLSDPSNLTLSRAQLAILTSGSRARRAKKEATCVHIFDRSKERSAL